MGLSKLISGNFFCEFQKVFLPSKVGHNISLGQNKHSSSGQQLHHQDFLNTVSFCPSVFGIHHSLLINFVKEVTICPPLELSMA